MNRIPLPPEGRMTRDSVDFTKQNPLYRWYHRRYEFKPIPSEYEINFEEYKKRVCERKYEPYNPMYRGLQVLEQDHTIKRSKTSVEYWVYGNTAENPLYRKVQTW
ncbi:hypothetical protein C4577_07415 [Candidatus Parcubacteria bacterium]|nr:MAG: hypothetical protein C4577_07415 [Candidatus Parcubacteria bacterium]